ncbi:MAG: PAS domain-containing protein, partial [Sphingomonadales bacterium]
MNSRFRQFVNHYKSLDSKGGLPLKSAISPARILDLLPNVFIIQRTAAGRVLVRLYGTELVDIFGTDMTGKDAIE